MSRTCAAVLLSLLGVAPAWSQSIATAPPPAAAPATAAASPTAEAPRMPSFGSLFTDLGHDVMQMPSLESAWILGIGGALAAGVHHNDPNITASASGNESLDEALDPGSPIGSGWVQIGGAFALYAIGRGNGNVKTAITGADLIRAQILTGAITQTVKLAVGRTRPDAGRYSFPSGHSSSAFATAAVLERHYGLKVGLPAYAAAAYVGGSRIAENKHYLSDVIFGAAIGVVCGRATSVGRGRARMALSPIAAPGGGGIQFTWLGRNVAQGG